MVNDLESLRERVRRFATERDWERFHTPKNLALALAGEVGELAAVLQWLPEAEIGPVDEELRSRLADEMADVLLYLVRLADVTDVDLGAVAHAKIDRNEHRYPRDAAYGSALKYNQL
jgi:dCTP diphosphatase